jgi:hypothetical protein
MNLLLINTIGVIGGLSSILNFVLQLIKTILEKNASGISLRMVCNHHAGLCALDILWRGNKRLAVSAFECRVFRAGVEHFAPAAPLRRRLIVKV